MLKTDNRIEIYRELCTLLVKHSPPLTIHTNGKDKYELISKKEVEYLGRKYKEMFFASAVIQSSYVGLYLMHVYAKPEMLEDMPASLRKCLKGKSCFHIKKLDEELKEIIAAELKRGIACYKKIKFI